VCDLVLPDPAFIATLTPEVRERYLGDISFSSFCVARK
jgi:hypothetical protein